MHFRYVTSMSERMYQDFGKEMLEGLLNYWPEGEILCYTEDELPITDKRIKLVPLGRVPGYSQFSDAVSKIPLFRGESDGRYNYRFNIAAFCKKIFAQIDAAVNYRGYLFWVDSDVKTFKPIPAVKLEEWMSGNFAIVMKRKNWHLCASFVGWDCAHAFAPIFFEHYFLLHVTGKVFLLPEWHDSFVLEQCLGQTPGVLDLGKDFTGEGPYNIFDQVFEGYAKHLKGNLKVPTRYFQLMDIAQSIQPKRFIEIGTWRGDQPINLRKVCSEFEYIGLDLFEEADKRSDKDEKNVKKHYSLEYVDNRLTESGIPHRLYKGDSKHTFKQYLKDYGKGSAELIYIDGGHSLKTIKQDFENAKLAVKRNGGMIVFDDYYTEMPKEELERFGAQSVLKDVPHFLLPAIDSVKGGGKVQMAVVKC